MRRRAPLCGLAALSGCAGVLDGDTDRGRETVNPELAGTPEPPPGVAWTAAVDADRLYPAGDAVVAVRERDDRERHVALSTVDGTRRWRVDFEGPHSVRPGDALVAWSIRDEGAPIVGLDPATGERRWSVAVSGAPSEVTDGTVVVRRGDPTRTVAYDRVDGSVRWESRVGEVYLGRTTDPVLTLERTDPGDTVRLRGRTTADGTVVWAVSAPERVRSTDPVAEAGDRVLLVGDRRFYVVDTAAETLAGRGTVSPRVATDFGVRLGDAVVFGDGLPGASSQPPALLARVDLGYLGATTVETAGESLVPRARLGDRVAAAVQTGDGTRTVGVDPAAPSVEWDAPGVPLGGVSESVAVATRETVRAHAPDGSVRWRADRPTGGRVGALGAFDDANADGFVYGQRVLVVGESGVVSWDATDGEVRTATTAVGASETWTLADDTVVVAADDRLSAVRV